MYTHPHVHANREVERLRYNQLVSWCFKPIIIVIINYPLTARVVGAP